MHSTNSKVGSTYRWVRLFTSTGRAVFGIINGRIAITTANHMEWLNRPEEQLKKHLTITQP